MNGLRLDHRRASLLSFAVALLVPVTFAACKKAAPPQQRPLAAVSVAVARRATVPYVIEANGIVTPMQSVSVTPQVDGIIMSVDFQEGEEVRSGQPLFHIDSRPYQNAFDQAVAVLARDSANFAHAQTEADRYSKLLAQRVITPQEAGTQITTAQTAEATMRADRAAVANAKFNLDNTVIRAPISGKTGSLLVKRGNLVRSGGAAPLVVINQVRPIYVRFSVPSSQLPIVLQYGARGGLPVAAVPGGIAAPTPSIDSLAAAAMAQPSDAIGQQANGGSGGSGGNGGNGGGRRGGRRDGNAESGGPSDVASNGEAGGRRGGRGPGAGGNGEYGQRGRSQNGAAPVQQATTFSQSMTGKLSFIDNAVDTATGTVQLKATFDNSTGRLWAGQFATTSLHLYDQENALVVPQQAIVTGQRGSYVYVVDQADTARQRAVIVERTADGLAIIASGIHDGDRVVTEGQSRLTPDAPVRLRGAGDANGRGGNGNGGGRRGGGRGGKRGGNGGGSGGGE
jgi:multidrug efflux pump subunit AcrA (membrane-fusion protein)